MKQWMLFTITLLLSGSSYAQLSVVNTDGPTVAAAPYLKDIHYPKNGYSLSSLKVNRSGFKEKSVCPQEIGYPAVSTLTPGKVMTRQIKTKYLSRPLFVMGDDPVSIRWAKDNTDELKRIGAFGVITNVKNKARVEQIEQETGVTLLPASLSDLSHYLKISHYPFLWTKSDIEQ